jgi:hypothetical protein
MSRIAFATVIALGLAAAPGAFAQSSMNAPNNGADNSVNPTTKPGLAATSSDSGQMGTGASSSKIGTGTVSHGATGTGNQNSGTVGTEAPATAGNTATGAHGTFTQPSQ